MSKKIILISNCKIYGKKWENLYNASLNGDIILDTIDDIFISSGVVYLFDNNRELFIQVPIKYIDIKETILKDITCLFLINYL